jgi:hypothetical protein
MRRLHGAATPAGGCGFGWRSSDSTTFGCPSVGKSIPYEKAARKERQMCMSCGCGEPHETHGDKRNIVYADLKKAADASNITVKEAVKNIGTTLRTKNPRSPVGR